MRVPTYLESFYDEEGRLTNSGRFYNDDINQSLRESLSDDGWRAPVLETAQISEVFPSSPAGTFWYDSTVNELRININGVLHRFNTTPV